MFYECMPLTGVSQMPAVLSSGHCRWCHRAKSTPNPIACFNFQTDKTWPFRFRECIPCRNVVGIMCKSKESKLMLQSKVEDKKTQKEEAHRILLIAKFYESKYKIRGRVDAKDILAFMEKHTSAEAYDYAELRGEEYLGNFWQWQLYIKQWPSEDDRPVANVIEVKLGGILQRGVVLDESHGASFFVRLCFVHHQHIITCHLSLSIHVTVFMVFSSLTRMASHRLRPPGHRVSHHERPFGSPSFPFKLPKPKIFKTCP